MWFWEKQEQDNMVFQQKRKWAWSFKNILQEKNIEVKTTELTEEASVLLSSYQAFIAVLWNIIGDNFLLGVWHKSYKLLKVLGKQKE